MGGYIDWWAVVCTVMNFRFHKVCGIAWLTEKQLLRRTPLHAVSQLLTAQQAVYPYTTQYITVLWTATLPSTAPTPHSVHCTFHCTLSVGTVKGCCTVQFVLFCQFQQQQEAISYKHAVANWTIWNISKWSSVLIRFTDFHRLCCWQ